MDNTINSLVSQAVGVSDQQIRDFLANNPTDAQIVSAMQTYGVSPTQLANVVGVTPGEVIARAAATIPYGNTAMLGDVVVQPLYDVQGSGETQQIGPITGINVTKSTGNVNDTAPVGSQYQTYNPDGTLQNTGIVQKYEGSATKDFLRFALGAAGMAFGLPALGIGEGATLGSLGGLGTAGTVGADLAGLSGIPAGAGALTAAESAALYGTGGAAGLGTNYGLGTGATGVAGMGTGTGITTGYSGLGLNAGTAGLGAEGLGAGITAGSGLTGTGVLLGSTLGKSLLGSSALNNLVGTGVLTGSNLGANLLGTGVGAGLTGTGILTGSGLGTALLGTGAGSGVTGGVTGLGGTTLGTGALTTGVGSGGGTGGVVGGGTGLVTGGGTGTGVVGGGTGTGVVGGTGTGLGTGLLSTGTGLLASGLGNTLGSIANQQGITDARNLINQYGGQAANSLATAYNNAQGLNAANRTDLSSIYGNTAGNMQNLYNQQVGYQQPYQQIGNQGATGLAANQDYLTHQFNANDLNANLAPNYAFQLQQGQMANQRAGNMAGGALGGNALQGLQRYTQDYAGGAYQNAFNNYNTQRNNIYNSLAGMANIGTTSAGQLAGLGNTYGSNLGSLSSNLAGNLTTSYGQGIGAANAYGLNTANLATGIGSALASNATQTGANNAAMLSNLGNTALLGSMLKAT
jgi:hypothetical protein